MGSGDGGGLGSSCSGKLAPGWAALAPLCWDHVGTVPRAQRASPATLPPAWAGPGNSAHGHRVLLWAVMSSGHGAWGGWETSLQASGGPRGQRACQLPAGPGPGPCVLLLSPRGLCSPPAPGPSVSSFRPGPSDPTPGGWPGTSRGPVPATQLLGVRHRAPCRGRRPGAARSSACCFSPTPGPPQGQGTES